ncbi:MAG: ferritin-like domain-containing protein [Gammaproteobacteria bacterium]|nr:ferritin-like domain-containing protein [Gammaproteobacteria bacterium]
MHEPTPPGERDRTRNLHFAAEQCLLSADIASKLELAHGLQRDLEAGLLRCEPLPEMPSLIDAGRPARPELVAPSQLVQRKLGTREGVAALLHAVAHIEFNAINLACDAVYRFRDMPDDYYHDWARVAAEEAYHFSLLQRRLEQLGHTYGDFPAHNGLWELAQDTASDVLLRMALVPRVMEARGLDVTPGMIRRFAAIGDEATVAVLEIILRDEIGHVEAGSRWFHYLCRQRGLDAESTYFSLLERHLGSNVRCPLHREARLQAGFSESELGRLEALCAKH